MIINTHITTDELLASVHQPEGVSQHIGGDVSSHIGGDRRHAVVTIGPTHDQLTDIKCPVAVVFDRENYARKIDTLFIDYAVKFND